jgi:hypothetical protein
MVPGTGGEGFGIGLIVAIANRQRATGKVDGTPFAPVQAHCPARRTDNK